MGWPGPHIPPTFTVQNSAKNLIELFALMGSVDEEEGKEDEDLAIPAGLSESI